MNCDFQNFVLLRGQKKMKMFLKSKVHEKSRMKLELKPTAHSIAHANESLFTTKKKTIENFNFRVCMK